MNLLIETAKKKGGFLSDYQIAKAIEASPQLVSNWQKGKSKPNGLYTAKIMEVGKLDAREAIEAMENGYIDLSLLIVTGFVSIALFEPIRKALDCILCKIDLHLTRSAKATFS